MMKVFWEDFSFVGESITSAAGNIAASRLRSWITASIIALGVASLVGTQTSIDSLAALLNGALGGKSCDSFTISAAKGDRHSSLSRSCLKQFEENFDSADGIAVYTYVPALGQVRGPLGQLSPGTVVVAFEGDYLRSNALSISLGREFSTLEESNGSKVCLVGHKVADALGEGGPLGKTVTVAGQSFRVVGTISEQLSFLGVIAGNTVFVPLSAARGALVDDSCSFSADVLLPPGSDSDEAASRAGQLMGRISHTTSQDGPSFEITQGDALKKETDSLSGKLSLVALAVGLLTILGAAVGLTNIMLIAIRERTREIGLRRALGASHRDILVNLLTESALICSYGCSAGILLGVIVGNIVSAVLHTPLQIPWDWIFASCLICAAVCIAAGWVPARRASGMDPVEALRCE